MTLSAIVLTRNEANNIQDCLQTLSWADEMLVVDSGSTDQTLELAAQYGARTLSHAFKDFASQRNFAMTQAKGDWVLFIDADERVTPELAQEIRAIVHAQGKDLGVYAIPRVTYFFGRQLRFCDARGDAPRRLFPRARVTWIQPVHETIVTDLPYCRLKNQILHYSTRDLAHYQHKVREYVPLELDIMQKKGLRPSLLKAIVLPSAKFLQLFVFKFGFLDGVAGFQYAILSSYFYTFQKYWLYWRNSKEKSS